MIFFGENSKANFTYFAKWLEEIYVSPVMMISSKVVIIKSFLFCRFWISVLCFEEWDWAGYSDEQYMKERDKKNRMRFCGDF